MEKYNVKIERLIKMVVEYDTEASTSVFASTQVASFFDSLLNKMQYENPEIGNVVTLKTLTKVTPLSSRDESNLLGYQHKSYTLTEDQLRELVSGSMHYRALQRDQKIDKWDWLECAFPEDEDINEEMATYGAEIEK